MKKSVQVVSSLQEQVEIDPSPKGLVEVAPSPPSVDPPASEDTHTCTQSAHIEPSRTSLSSLLGLETLKAPVLKRETLNEAYPMTLPDRPETTLERQGSDSNDSVRSDVAVFGDIHNLSNDTVKIVPNQHQIETPRVQKVPIPVATAQRTLPQTPRIQVVPAQTVPAQNTPVQVQHPLVNQIEEQAEVAKLAVPGLIPVFTPPRPKHALVQFPGLFSPPLTPNSPQPKLLGPQQKSPLAPTNLFLSPSPIVVIPNLGAPSSPMPPTPITPTTPTMPPTPIKHQVKTPVVTDQALNIVADRTPVLPPRSPRRPPPHGFDPVSTVDGEKKDFGAIGDRKVCLSSAGFNGMAPNQPPMVVGDPTDKPETEEEDPLVIAESTPECHGVEDRENREGAEPQPDKIQPRIVRAVYIGEMKYYIGRYLGGGGTGKVYSVVSKESMNMTALKVIKRKHLDSEDVAMVRGEWAILKAISEAKFFQARRPDRLQFLHHLLESWYDEENIYFVMVRSAGFVTSLTIDDRFL